MAQYMFDRGHDIVVFTPKDGELANRLRESNSKIEIVDFQWTKNSYWNPITQWSLRNKIKQASPHVIIYNSIIDVRAAAFAAKQAGVGTNIYRAGMPAPPKVDWSYQRAFQKGLDWVVGISNENLQIIKRESPGLISPDMKTKVITNGIDMELFKPRLDLSPQDETMVFGNCTRLSDQKGLDMFMHVCHKLKSAQVPRFSALLGGTGEDEKKLKDMRRELNLDQDIEMVGFIEDTQDFYPKLDFVLFTSKFEGSARTIIESLACGVPVIAFDTSSMSEMIEHGVNGFLVSPFDLDTMASHAKELINDREKCRKMGEAARKYAMEKYNQAIIYKNWAELIESHK